MISLFALAQVEYLTFCKQNLSSLSLLVGTTVIMCSVYSKELFLPAPKVLPQTERYEHKHNLHSNILLIFTYSKQAFNMFNIFYDESLEFCNPSLPHELLKI